MATARSGDEGDTSGPRCSRAAVHSAKRDPGTQKAGTSSGAGRCSPLAGSSALPTGHGWRATLQRARRSNVSTVLGRPVDKGHYLPVSGPGLFTVGHARAGPRPRCGSQHRHTAPEHRHTEPEQRHTDPDLAAHQRGHTSPTHRHTGPEPRRTEPEDRHIEPERRWCCLEASSALLTISGAQQQAIERERHCWRDPTYVLATRLRRHDGKTARRQDGIGPCHRLRCSVGGERSDALIDKPGPSST